MSFDAHVETVSTDSYALITVTMRATYGVYQKRSFYVQSVNDLLESMLDADCRIESFTVSDLSETLNPRFTSECGAMNIILMDAQNYWAPVASAWENREYSRIGNGHYRPILCDFDFSFNPQHLVHLPLEISADTSLIAYTETPDKGRRDKQNTVSFGRYLKKFFPDMPNTEIERNVVKFRASQIPAVYTLNFASDIETINEIFETRLGACSDSKSCMYGKFTTWKNRPYHVYANAPDVSIAYLSDSEGEIVARTVVTTSKRWIRFYARSEYDFRKHEATILDLKTKLTELGYRSGSLEGCTLSYVERNGNVLAPYFDGSADEFDIIGDNQILMTEGGRYKGDDTEGIASDNGDSEDEDEERFECGHCGNSVDSEDDLNYSDTFDCGACENCTQDHVTAISNSRGRTVFIDCDSTVSDCNGEYYTSAYADDNLVYRNDEYHTDDCSHLEIECAGADCSNTTTDENEYTDDLCEDCLEERDALEAKETADRELALALSNSEIGALIALGNSPYKTDYNPAQLEFNFIDAQCAICLYTIGVFSGWIHTPIVPSTHSLFRSVYA